MTDEKLPRERVLTLLKKMAKTSALVGSALGLAATESCGIIVCDPLPPPLSCPNPGHDELTSAVWFDASWVDVDGGPLEVLLHASDLNGGGLAFTNGVTVTGGTLRSAQVNLSGSGLEVAIAPATGSTTLTVVLSYTCSSTPTTMTVTLDVSAPRAGGSVAVHLVSP